MSLLLSKLERKKVPDHRNAEIRDSLATEFLMVLKVIKSFSDWAEEVMESWVTYHITREQIGKSQQMLIV